MWSSGVTGTRNIGLLLGWQSFERVEDAVGARIDRNGRAKAPEDLALTVDDEQGALANTLVFTIRTVRLRDRALRVKIRKQRKMQVAIPDEGRVTPRAIDRNAQQLGAMLAKLRKDLVVQGHLIAADRAPVRGIEGEDDRRAPQVTERQELVRRDTQREIGGRGAGRQNIRHVSSPYRTLS